MNRAAAQTCPIKKCFLTFRKIYRKTSPAILLKKRFLQVFLQVFAQVFSRELCDIFKNTFLNKTRPLAASR